MDAAYEILTEQHKSATELRDIKNADEKVSLIKFQDHHKNTHAQGGTHAHGSDEEEDGEGGQEGVRVGCPQQ